MASGRSRLCVTNEDYKQYLLERIEINPRTGCWEWTRNRSVKGYGEVGIRITPERRAHRLSWAVFVGPIPLGDLVLHHCDNPPCINPDHLYVGDSFDNNQDTSKRGRQNKEGSGWRKHQTHCVNGHEFTEENTYVTKTGSRQCRQCQRDRRERAAERKSRGIVLPKRPPQVKMDPEITYVVTLQAIATKQMIVKTRDGQNRAAALAVERSLGVQTGWTISLPGDVDSHVPFVAIKQDRRLDNSVTSSVELQS